MKKMSKISEYIIRLGAKATKTMEWFDNSEVCNAIDEIGTLLFLTFCIVAATALSLLLCAMIVTDLLF